MLFNEFYEQHVIRESVNNVPRKDLGMSTSIVDLPERTPYGFWVDRSGNFLEVGREDHIGGLVSIVNKAKQFLQAQGVSYAPSYLYKDLLDLGWIRVMLSPRWVYYETAKGQIATSAQRRFLEDLKELYNKEGVIQDNH